MERKMSELKAELRKGFKIAQPTTVIVYKGEVKTIYEFLDAVFKKYEE